MSFFSFGGSPDKNERSSFFSMGGAEDDKTKSFFSDMGGAKDDKAESTKSFFSGMGDTDDGKNESTKSFFTSKRDSEDDVNTESTKSFFTMDWTNKDDSLSTPGPSSKKLKVDRDSLSSSKSPSLHVQSNVNLHQASSGNLVEAQAKPNETKRARSASDDHFVHAQGASSQSMAKAQAKPRVRSAERAASEPQEPTIRVEDTNEMKTSDYDSEDDDDDVAMILRNARASLDNIMSMKYKEIKKLDEEGEELLGRSSTLLNDITNHNEKLEDAKQQWTSQILLISKEMRGVIGNVNVE